MFATGAPSLSGASAHRRPAGHSLSRLSRATGMRTRRRSCAERQTCRRRSSASDLAVRRLQVSGRAFLQGKCFDGENCSCAACEMCFMKMVRFAHGDSDLRVTAGIYKTQICNFYERGHCKKGDRCNHAHGDADLRPTMSPQKTPAKEKGCQSSPIRL